MVGAAAQSGKLNVFISYSRDDLDFADQLDAALGLAGFETTIDRHGISAGEDWKKRLGDLILHADTVVFALSPSSARSETCAWEVAEAVRLSKRILPVLCRPLDGVTPPHELSDLNYIYFYKELRSPGSGFGTGLVGLVSGLNTNLDWLREHTRYLQRSTEWDAGGKPANRLLSGPDIAAAKDWAAGRPKNAPELTPLQLDFIKASEAEVVRQQSAEAQRLQEIADAQAERGRALADREAAQAREAEAQRRELAEAHKIAVRTRIFALVVMALLVVATLVAVWAINQQQLARRNEFIALLRLADAQSGRHPLEATKIALALLADRKEYVIPGTSSLGVLPARLEQIRTGLENFALGQRQPPDELAIYDVLAHSVPNLRELKVLQNGGRYAEFTSDGKRIVVASDRFKLKVLDPETGSLLSAPLDYRRALYATSRDEGKLILTRSEDAARLWDATTGRQLVKLEDARRDLELTWVALSRDGKQAAAAWVSDPGADLKPGHEGPTLQLWDLDASTGAMLASLRLELRGRPGEEHTGRINSVAFSNDGTRIVTASVDGTAKIWNTKGECERTLYLPDRGLYAAFSPDGKRVVTVWDDDAARVWEIADGKPVGQEMNHERRINFAAFSPDGTQIVTASDDGTARLWDASSDQSLGVLVATLAGHGGRVNSASFNLDGTRILTASDDDTVRIWDNVRGRAIITLAGPKDALWSAALNRDKTRVVTASKDSVARIWDTKTGLPVGDPMQHSGDVTYAEFNRAGDRLVTASAVDGTQLWDAKTGELKRRFDDAGATYAVFSPDGALICTAYQDGKARIWKTANGEPMI